MNIRNRLRRPSFTLIELIVVMAIIALLLSLTAGAVTRFFGTQQVANTKSLIRSLDSNLQKQRSAIFAAANEGQPPPAAIQTAAGTAATDPGGKRARVLYAKLLLKQAFPMTFAEALSSPLPGVIGPYDPYVKYLTDLGITANTPPQPWESSACLLMAMQIGPKNTGVQIENFGTNAISFQPTPNKSRIRYFVDGWGNPLVFCRSPFASAKLNPGGAQPGVNNDVDDPNGELTKTNWAKAGNVGYTTTFASWFYYTPPLGSANKSYVLTPLIVSPGPDGLSGYVAPPSPPVPPDQTGPNPAQGLANDATGGTYATDNIYNVDLSQ
jgi:prepilin-type N-terminal cleavage/methylation domain-containing protein